MTRSDAITYLAATLEDAEARAEGDLRKETGQRVERVEVPPRDFYERLAECLVRYAPSNGLSIRLDDGSEFPE